ncbi:MAG: ArsA family ATPase [Bdellovibrionia bacterium]
MNPTPGEQMDLDSILKKRKVLITCGMGGVGKTTLSAAIAIRAALMGKKVAVITIDPAKRLANSLGLDSLDDHPKDITSQLRESLQHAQAQNLFRPNPNWNTEGSLSAIMPDTRRTFENFVHELSPHPAVTQKVIENPIFQIFAKEFSGTNEYMALERLLSLYRSGQYDFIVLDTPPSRNTLAFLNAPQLLARFFDEKLVRLLVLPANQLLSSGIKKALSILEKLTGAGFMTHLFDFAASLFEVQVNFSASLKKITTLLQSSEVGFLMVTTPTMDAIEEAKHFIQSVQEHQFSFDGIILNRTLEHLDPSAEPLEPSQIKPYQGAFEIMQDIRGREQIVTENLQKTGIPICAKVTELARDVHSVEDLLYVATALQPHPH